MGKLVAAFAAVALAGAALLGNGITGMFAASESCCMGPDCPAAQLCGGNAQVQSGAASFWLGIILCGVAVFYLALHTRHQGHNHRNRD
jgi:hypothetical protein